MSPEVTDKLGPILERLEASPRDDEAWALLYQQLWPLVFSISYRALRGVHHLATDASQEAFFRLFRYARFASFKDRPDEFRAYVMVVARNVARTYLKKLSHSPSFDAKEGEELESEGSLGQVGIGRGENTESAIIRQVELRNLLEGLDRAERELAMLLAEGHSVPEIAERLGLSYSNAAVRIHRLRRSLYNLLKTRDLYLP